MGNKIRILACRKQASKYSYALPTWENYTVDIIQKIFEMTENNVKPKVVNKAIKIYIKRFFVYESNKVQEAFKLADENKDNEIIKNSKAPFDEEELKSYKQVFLESVYDMQDYLQKIDFFIDDLKNAIKNEYSLDLLKMTTSSLLFSNCLGQVNISKDDNVIDFYNSLLNNLKAFRTMFSNFLNSLSSDEKYDEIMNK